MNNMAKLIGALWVVLCFTNPTARAGGEAFSSAVKLSTLAVQSKAAPDTRPRWTMGSNADGTIHTRIAPNRSLFNLRALDAGVVCGSHVLRGAGAVSVSHVIWGTLV